MKRAAALLLIFLLLLPACAVRQDGFTPDSVSLTQPLSSTFPGTTITDPEAVQHLWVLCRGLSFDGTAAGLDRENVWSIIALFTDSTSGETRRFTFFSGGLCCVGEDYETFHVLREGSAVYDQMRNALDAKRSAMESLCGRPPDDPVVSRIDTSVLF